MTGVQTCALPIYVPEIECHTQDTAQIIADSGVDANWAVVVARFVAY